MTKNIFDTTVEALINDAELLTNKYNRFLNDGKTRDAIDNLRLLKDTLSLIKEYDWHLEYSQFETDSHSKIAVWEQNHSGKVKNKKEWIIGNTIMYIDYGIGVTVVYLNGRKFYFDLKNKKENFINFVLSCYRQGNIKIYVDNSGLGRCISDLLDKHGVSYMSVRNAYDEE